jgi:hypothetical protein
MAPAAPKRAMDLNNSTTIRRAPDSLRPEPFDVIGTGEIEFASFIVLRRARRAGRDS